MRLDDKIAFIGDGNPMLRDGDFRYSNVFNYAIWINGHNQVCLLLFHHFLPFRFSGVHKALIKALRNKGSVVLPP